MSIKEKRNLVQEAYNKTKDYAQERSASKKSQQRKATIKKYLTGTIGGGALAAAAAIPSGMGTQIWKKRKLISRLVKSGAKNTKASQGLAAKTGAVKNTAGRVAGAVRKAIGKTPFRNEAEQGFVRGAIAGGAGIAIQDQWNKSKAKKRSNKVLDRASDFINKKIESYGASNYNAQLGSKSNLAEFAVQSNSNTTNASAITPASERFLDWKAKKKILGKTLKYHGRLKKKGASKKLGAAKEGVAKAGANYGEIADIAKRRLSQIGAVASATGRNRVADLASQASGAMEASKAYVPKYLKDTENKLGGAKQAFDTISAVKTAGKGLAATGVVAGGLALGARTTAGKNLIDRAGKAMKYMRTVRAAKKMIGK